MITLSDGRAELFQWDTGRVVRFQGSCQQFHFSNKVYGRTVDVTAEQQDGASTAKIPDFLLQTAVPLSVYAFVGSDLDGYTKIEKVFQVKRRNKPSDYVFTPQEQQTIKNAQEYADAAAGSAKEAAKAAAEAVPLASRAEAAAQAAEQSQQAAEGHAQAAKQSQDAAAGSAEAADTDAGRASQALADLLAMLGTDIATLVGGKIPVEQIPSIATTEIYTAASQQEQEAITAENGDILIRTDENKSYIWKDSGWVYLASPTDFAAKAGYAETAGTAENANKINGHRMVEMTQEAFETAVKDPETYYLVYDSASEV